MDEYDSYEVEEVGIYLFYSFFVFKSALPGEESFFSIKDCTLYEQ